MIRRVKVISNKKLVYCTETCLHLQHLMTYFFQELENYIKELIPTLPQLDGLEKSFHMFYICTAVRKFMFFLDPLHTGRVRIQDILACGFLDQLIEVSNNLQMNYEIMRNVLSLEGYTIYIFFYFENKKIISSVFC